MKKEIDLTFTDMPSNERCELELQIPDNKAFLVEKNSLRLWSNVVPIPPLQALPGCYDLQFSIHPKLKLF